MASSFPQEINNISSGGLKLVATCTIVSGSYSYDNKTPIDLSAWSGLKPLICECKAIGDVVVSEQTQISFTPTYSYGQSLVELPKNQTFPSGITSYQILYPVTVAQFNTNVCNGMGFEYMGSGTTMYPTYVQAVQLVSNSSYPISLTGSIEVNIYE